MVVTAITARWLWLVCIPSSGLQECSLQYSVSSLFPPRMSHAPSMLHPLCRDLVPPPQELVQSPQDDHSVHSVNCNKSISYYSDQCFYLWCIRHMSTFYTPLYILFVRSLYTISNVFNKTSTAFSYVVIFALTWNNTDVSQPNDLIDIRWSYHIIIACFVLIISIYDVDSVEENPLSRPEVISRVRNDSFSIGLVNNKGIVFIEIINIYP